MQGSELDVSRSLVHIHTQALYQEPQGLVLTSDSDLVHGLRPKYVSCCWRRLQYTQISINI